MVPIERQHREQMPFAEFGAITTGVLGLMPARWRKGPWQGARRNRRIQCKDWLQALDQLVQLSSGSNCFVSVPGLDRSDTFTCSLIQAARADEVHSRPTMIVCVETDTRPEGIEIIPLPHPSELLLVRFERLRADRPSIDLGTQGRRPCDDIYHVHLATLVIVGLACSILSAYLVGLFRGFRWRR